MDAFWIIKGSFSLFGTKLAKKINKKITQFGQKMQEKGKKCKKKGLNLKMRTKTD
jgi:hypothetical protein